MKYKKIIFILIAVLILLLLGTVKSNAVLELNDLEFNAQINEDGSMQVTEIWDIDISNTNTLFKTFEKDNTKYTGIKNVFVKETTLGSYKNFRKINEEMYHVTKDCYYALDNSNGEFEIAWGVGLDNSSDTRRYEITYLVQDAIAKYKDYAELYWQFIGENFEIDAKQIRGTILLPQNAISKDDIKVWGHTQELNGEIYVTDLNKIEFNINNYSSGNYVEIRSLIPNFMITSSNRNYNYDIKDIVLEEETKWANEANARRERKQLVNNILAIIFFSVTLFVIIRIIFNIRKLIKLDKKIKPSVELKYFRELPYEDATPAEAKFILSKCADTAFSSSFSANILDLCLKKYIKVETIEKNGKIKSNMVKIILLDKEIENLKKDQKTALEFLKEVAGDKTEITTKDITKYLEKHPSEVERLNQKIESNIENEEQQRGNFIKENMKLKEKIMIKTSLSFIPIFFFFPLIPLTIALIINMIINIMIIMKINVLTQKGMDEREQWKAFKKYMEDFSLLKEKEVPALALWEKYLVFATAFGISEKVLKQLKVIYPEMTDVNSAMYTYSYIHIMNSVNIGNCINTSVYSAISSSGSGAGGGFSGGGGGGRWPEVAVVDAKNNFL